MSRWVLVLYLNPNLLWVTFLPSHLAKSARSDTATSKARSKVDGPSPHLGFSFIGSDHHVRKWDGWFSFCFRKTVWKNASHKGRAQGAINDINTREDSSSSILWFEATRMVHSLSSDCRMRMSTLINLSQRLLAVWLRIYPYLQVCASYDNGLRSCRKLINLGCNSRKGLGSSSYICYLRRE